MPWLQIIPQHPYQPDPYIDIILVPLISANLAGQWLLAAGGGWATTKQATQASGHKKRSQQAIASGPTSTRSVASKNWSQEQPENSCARKLDRLCSNDTRFKRHRRTPRPNFQGVPVQILLERGKNNTLRGRVLAGIGWALASLALLATAGVAGRLVAIASGPWGLGPWQHCSIWVGVFGRLPSLAIRIGY